MTNESVTAYGASAAMFSPWWLPSLHKVSEVAAEIVPILGVVVLITQLIRPFIEKRKQTN